MCTSPQLNNGFGLTPAETDARATLIESRFRLLPDSERVHREWRRLVVAHSVAGVTMPASSPRSRSTTGGFARYPGISVLPPRVLAPAVSGQ